MKKYQPGYSEEYKKRAVEMIYRSAKSIKAIARELEIARDGNLGWEVDISIGFCAVTVS